MTLGRKWYDTYRLSEGKTGDDGFWEDGAWVKGKIFANIQGGLYWNAVKNSDSGDISKNAISIRSDHPIYQSDTKHKGDIISWLGTLWEVREVRPYENLRATRHWEGMAVQIDSKTIPRESL